VVGESDSSEARERCNENGFRGMMGYFVRLETMNLCCGRFAYFSLLCVVNDTRHNFFPNCRNCVE